MHKHSLTAIEYALLITGSIVLYSQTWFIAITSGMVLLSLSSVCYGIKCERQVETATEAKYLKFLANVSAFLNEWEVKNRREIDNAFEKLRKAENRIPAKDTTNRIAIEYARSQVRQLAKKLKFPELERKTTKELSINHK